MYEIIKDIIPLLTGPPAFVHGTEGWLNIVADKTGLKKGLVYLDQPLESEDSLHKSGYLEENYFLRMFFLKKSKLSWTPIEHNEVISEMRTLRAEFVSKLSANSSIRSIERVATMDVMNILDVNLSGTIVEIGVIPFNNYSSC